MKKLGVCAAACVFLCCAGTASAKEKALTEELFDPDGVCITEICTAHRPKSDEPDWVELYNGSAEDITLDGWTLSDREEKEGLALSGTLAAGAYRNISLKNAPFAISASGETVWLRDNGGNTVCVINCGALTAGVTEGRNTVTGETEYYVSPTPGAENAKGYEKRLPAPGMSETGLYHDEPFSVTLSCADSGAEIRYTLDGTQPGPGSALYSEPLEISKTTVVRAVAVKDGALNSLENAATYLFTEPHTVPVVCITGNPSELTAVFKKSSGHTRPEHKVRAAWYEPDGTAGTQFACDIRIKGNASTSSAYPQKSLAVHLRAGYGQSKVKYDFFGEGSGKKLSGFTLRSGGQDSNRTRIKDTFVSRVAMETNSESAQTRAVVVYRNGIYSGVYWFTETINEEYLAEKYGLNEEEIEITDRVHGVQAGTGKRYKKALEFAKKNSLKSTENYEKFCSMVDIASLTDTLILKMYFTDVDLYNQRWWSGNDGILHSVIFDNDLILMQGDENKIAVERMFRTGSGKYGGNVFYAALRKNKNWREYFLNRYAELLSCTLSEERLENLFEMTAEEIRPEMKKHLALYKKPKTVADWEKYVTIAEKELRKKRNEITEQISKEFGISKQEMEARIAAFSERAEQNKTSGTT